jgi:hypothetical protein
LYLSSSESFTVCLSVRFSGRFNSSAVGVHVTRHFLNGAKRLHFFQR